MRLSGIALTALLSLLQVSAHALDPALAIDQLHHTQWRSEDAAPSNIVAITQSADGFLWLGTGAGLYRFDGIRFERIKAFAGKALHSGSISALHATSSGQLLIGHRFGGVTITEPGRVVHYGSAALPVGNAWTFLSDKSGAIWGAFTGGVARLRDGVWETFPLDGEAIPFRTMVLDREGSIWVTAKTGAYVLALGAHAFRRVHADLPWYPYLSLAPDGRVWAADFKRLRIGPLVRDDSVFRSAPDKEHLPFPKGGEHHWFDSAGSLWIRRGAGMVRLPRPGAGDTGSSNVGTRAAQTFGINEGLTGEPYCFLEDREGNVWIGTAGGLDRFRQPTVMRVPLGRNDGSVGVAPGEAGRVWATTDSGGLYRVDGRPEPIPQVGEHVSHIHKDREGVVWIGSRTGLWKTDGRSSPVPVPRPDAADLRNDGTFAPVHAIAKDRAGVLWVSFVTKGTYRRVGSEWTPVSDALGARVMSLGNDSEGRLWIGYIDRGAARVDGDKVRTFKAVDGLNIGAVISIFARGSRVWFGGQQGLALYDGTIMRTVSFAGLPDMDVVSGIVETESGQLWINGANGLTAIDAEEWQRALREPDYRPRARRFGAHDGLLGSATQIRPLPSLIQAGDGRIWAAHPTGLFALEPHDLKVNGLAPAVVIQRIHFGGRAFDVDVTPSLPRGSSDVRVEFTATSLVIPQRVQFRYKLEGYDDDWRDSGGRRDAAYTHVSPGRYVFRVIAANNDGVWNQEGATITFTIPPAFWQTTWFAVLCIALAAALVWGLYRLRIRQISARVRDRMDQRMQERARIARELHDTLLQSVTGLALHVRAAADQVPRESPLRARLERALVRANSVMIEGRDRLSDLRLPNRHRVPLPIALERLCKELPGDFPGAGCTLTIRNPVRDIRQLVADETEHIAREAVTNALRHSGGVNITVLLDFDPTALRMNVRDDGRGFDEASGRVADRPGHFGFAGMRERASAIGAQLHVSSSPEGTEVRLVVPAGIAYVERDSSLESSTADMSRSDGIREPY